MELPAASLFTETIILAKAAKTRQGVQFLYILLGGYSAVLIYFTRGVIAQFHYTLPGCYTLVILYSFNGSYLSVSIYSQCCASSFGALAGKSGCGPKLRGIGWTWCTFTRMIVSGLNINLAAKQTYNLSL